MHGVTHLNLSPSSADFSLLQPGEQLSKQHFLYLWPVLLLFKGVFFLMVFLGAILKEICVGMCGERFQEPAS